VVEDGRLRGSGRARVVVAGDRVEELGRRAELFEGAQSEVDVAEQPALVGRGEDRRRSELARTPDVVDECSGEEEVAPQARMDLGQLPAEGRDADRVLQQAARVGVVTFVCGRICTQRRARERARDDAAQRVVADLAHEELEKPLELFRVPLQARRQLRRVDTLRLLEGPHLQLELVAEALHPAEDPHRVAGCAASVEQVDVVPDAGGDPTARVDEFEREIGGSAPCTQSLLACDRVDTVHRAVLLELRDGRHEAESRAASPGGCGDVGTVSPVAAVRPFRALRYDAAVAGPLERLVAPPYDVISGEQREELRARSPYNVVHLTLPDSEEEAAASLSDWRERGVLVQDPEPFYWWLSQEYVGPDGIARSRAGFVAALRAEPYAERVVLPHERTHAGPKEGRLRLLRATRTQLEPIFVLWDGTIDVDGLGTPDLEADEGGVVSRLWRLDAEFGTALTDELRDAQLLIADGHHRYETALAYHAEDGGDASAWLLAVVVPTDQEGLTIFPTHRVARSAGAAAGTPIDPPAEDLPGPVLYRQGRYELLDGDGLDPEIVERAAPAGVSYTPRRDDAVGAVDRGEAEAAFLLRPTRIEDVWAVARRGEVMPQKSTFFYPKLTSGLLLLPLSSRVGSTEPPRSEGGGSAGDGAGN
jgi:uncharacterized protein (DUF1015 family)